MFAVRIRESRLLALVLCTSMGLSLIMLALIGLLAQALLALAR